jgi:hypothetical protein
VMELPTSVEQVDPEFAYQYMTLIHRNRIVNGHSGYISPLVAWLGGGHSPFREAGRQRDAIAMLRGLGVRYLVVHRQAYEDAALADEMLAAIDGEPAQIVTRKDFDATTVAVLIPIEQPELSPGLSAIDAKGIRPSASHAGDRLPLLFDGDRDTRWLTAGHQTGSEWLSLEFDRSRDVRVLRMQLGTRSFGDYPRDLSIDAIEDGGERTLFRGTVLPQLARGIVGDGEYPFIEIVLPPNGARALRLRQLGSTRSFYWSIHELRLLERL